MKNRLTEGSLFCLKELHKNSATLQHAILKRNEWEPYVPTHFIYSFFTFNTLYNVNWEESIDYGQIRTHLSNRYNTITEHDKINSYIDFCCQDEEFLDIYKEFFVQYITRHYRAEDILSEFRNIQVDRRYSNGSLWRQQDINEFIDACAKCLNDNAINQEIIESIVGFIYKVRCNLFHGVKGMDELNVPSQQIRLDIYSLFIIAINQMVFSFIEYKDGRDITKGFSSLIELLRWKNSEPR